jgi:hypothetical protein
MRILKYLFLLLLLALLGMTVYVATQKGDFEVVNSRIIKAQRSTIFDYINDYRNWETFGAWMKKGDAIKFDYGAKSVGAGGKSHWQQNSDRGNFSTYYVKENDSIAQKAEFNQTHSYIYWTFKDTKKGTKVSVHFKGHMDLWTKVSAFFQGGIERFLDDVCTRSLRNLEKTLDYEMKTYSIKVNGISQRFSGYCLKQTVSSKIKNVGKNIKILMPRMVHFFKKNHIAMQGKPFILYERYDKTNDFVTLSVCIPTKKQLFLMPGSDVSSGDIIAFTCLKTTLIGDYSHTQQAWAEARKYVEDHQLKENMAGNYSEVYVKTIDDVKQPSKWITEIYIPVFPVADAIPSAITTVNQSITSKSTQSTTPTSTATTQVP